MVVDDSKVMRGIIRKMLAAFPGVGVIEARDGKEAWEVLQAEAVDVVLSDWNMPRMKGIDLLRLVRDNEKFKNLPFVMVTAEARAVDHCEADAATRCRRVPDKAVHAREPAGGPAAVSSLTSFPPRVRRRLRKPCPHGFPPVLARKRRPIRRGRHLPATPGARLFPGLCGGALLAGQVVHGKAALVDDPGGGVDHVFQLAG